MTGQEEKEHLLTPSHYNEDGFGNVNETYKEPKKQLNGVTSEYVNKMVRKTKGKANETI